VDVAEWIRVVWVMVRELELEMTSNLRPEGRLESTNKSSALFGGQNPVLQFEEFRDIIERSKVRS
jgi:hypothetical protein